MSSQEGSYNETDAQEILRRAAAVQNTGFMSRSELMRAAAEIGISPEAVEEAEKQYAEARAEEDLRSQYRAKRKSELFDSFKSVMVFGSVGAFVVNRNENWMWIAIIVVGCAFVNMLKEAALYYSPKSHKYQKGFQEFKEKEGRRKSLADRRTNDKLIDDILLGTSPSNKIDVIKNLRETTGLSLGDAKSAVDDYYGRHPEIMTRS